MQIKKIISIFTFLLSFNASIFATEGMWIPSLIDMFYSDMQTYGLKLTPEQVYSTNNSSLKDAVIQFNGGCTAEIVSKQGLFFTNHHCGYDAIQKLSSLENDFLKNGFWSKNMSEELPCPWLRVTFVKRIEDVTSKVLAGINDDTKIDDYKLIIAKNISELEKKSVEGTNFKAKVKPFNLGNQYYMLITEDFNDIRLVGTPPDAIGKFGGDTDNWVWPRHTGDFSVFRIYANDKNESAKYDKANKPYVPDHSLPIDLRPKHEGDFTMVYGFPGATDQHYSKAKLKFYIEKERPSRIKMRQTTLDILKPEMNENDLIRIQYSSKQARIANAWKKWIGQIVGLKELNALEKKAAWEETYLAKAAERSEWKEKYFPIINDLAKLQTENEKYEFAHAMFIEYFYVGPEFLTFTMDFYKLIDKYEDLVKDGKLQDEINRLQKKSDGFFKDYNKNIDNKIFNALTPMYIDYVNDSLLPNNISQTWSKSGNLIFTKSVFTNQTLLNSTLQKINKKTIKKLKNDPAYFFAKEVYFAHLAKVEKPYNDFVKTEERLMKIYLEGIFTMFPNKKVWPDANSTLRISFGKIEGSAPYDGMKYTHYTTIDGIMQKYYTENPDFELSDRFIELYKKKEYGNYTQNGELWVCFSASNHTTGGNSGSPVINADGYLSGINFDRSWESTMSDFLFDESRCRNIAVDIRYVLWVIEIYGGAKHLIDEMDLIRNRKISSDSENIKKIEIDLR